MEWVFALILRIHFTVHSELLCGNLTVSGSEWFNCTGTYLISEKIATKSKTKPVYKLEGQDWYIYFNPGGNGWRIGEEINLVGEKEGQSLFKSAYILLW